MIKVYLAPMAGITDYPFRKAVLKFGADEVTTEMVSSEALTRNSQKTFKRINIFNENTKKIVQIVGCDLNRMVESAKINEGIGADVIDINMGCPAKKIINSFAGSALMKDEKLACEIVKNVVNAVKIPITVKMRLGWDFESINAHILAQKFEELGVQKITIHARTRSQFYTGNANWKAIENIKKNVKIPVVCNGDIKTIKDAQTAISESTCDSIMVGRAAIGAPWLIRKMIQGLNDGNEENTKNNELSKKEELKNDEFNFPTIQEQLDVVLEHLDDTLQNYGIATGVCIFRKHICAYSKGMKDANNFRVKVNGIVDYKILVNAIQGFYEMNEENYVAVQGN